MLKRTNLIYKMASSKLNITKISHLDDESFKPNHLHFRIKGPEINSTVLNTLRRTMLEDIPCIAFRKINITTNTSVYNNDYMRNRIENFPLTGVNIQLKLDEYEILRKYTRGDNLENVVVNLEKEDDENESDVLTMYCKKVNETDNIISVTTEDAEFFKDDKKIKSIYKNPLLVVKLKPGEEIEFSARSGKGIALNNAVFAAVGVCCYEMINENEYIYKFESRNQNKLKDILLNTCKIIKYRLNLISEKTEKIKFSSDNEGKIKFINEDHTFGSLLTFGLQEHKNIEFAGYKLDNLLIKNLDIHYITNGGKTINSIIDDVTKKYVTFYDNLEKMLEKIV